MIRWILYHVCRYRDGRNKKAQSKNFHDDDNLEGGRGSGSIGSSTGGRSSGKYGPLRCVVGIALC